MDARVAKLGFAVPCGTDVPGFCGFDFGGFDFGGFDFGGFSFGGFRLALRGAAAAPAWPPEASRERGVVPVAARLVLDLDGSGM